MPQGIDALMNLFTEFAGRDAPEIPSGGLGLPGHALSVGANRSALYSVAAVGGLRRAFPPLFSVTSAFFLP